MNNLYKQLKQLLPDQPLLVGTVISVIPGGATIQLPGGWIINARGNATVGSNVFVRDNLIEGTAPPLATVIINI